MTPREAFAIAAGVGAGVAVCIGAAQWIATSSPAAIVSTWAGLQFAVDLLQTLAITGLAGVAYYQRSINRSYREGIIALTSALGAGRLRSVPRDGQP